MPTDTHQTPMGVYARPTPDFFEHESAYVNAQQVGPGAGNFAMVALFNNDVAGRLFRIHQIAIESDPAAQAGWYMIQRELNSQFSQALPIRPDQGQPPGIGLAGPVSPFFAPPAGAPVFTVPGSLTVLANPGFLGILPMGWSWALVSLSPTANLSATWWYTFSDAP